MSNRTSFPYIYMVVLACLVVLPAKARSDLRDLAFYTETYPPANFLHNNQISGYAVDMLLEASELVGEPVSLKQVTLQPWARSYRTVLTEKNAVLFSTTRSEHREKLFKWVGPIAGIKVVVLARKDANIKIDHVMDMANYKIGVIRDDIGEQSLLSLGLPRDSMQEASYVTILAEQLKKKRIDLLVYSQRAAFWWSKQADIDPNLFEPVYLIRQGKTYFAFNKDTDSEYVEKLQRGMEMLKVKSSTEASRYDQILDNY